jgi:hypothetical protein
MPSRFDPRSAPLFLFRDTHGLRQVGTVR